MTTDDHPGILDITGDSALNCLFSRVYDGTLAGIVNTFRCAIKLPKIGTFQAKCAACADVFPSPQLSDIAYGEFILTGTHGTVHAHLIAIDNEAWKIVESIVPNADADTLQELVARIADPVKGQSLTISHICPSCRSNDWDYWGGDRIGFIDVPSATFDSFRALSADQQVRHIHKLVDEISR